MDIYQLGPKIILPKVGKNRLGQATTSPGSCQYFVFHTKTQMAGPFKSYQDAFATAEEMIGRHYTKKDLEKVMNEPAILARDLQTHKGMIEAGSKVTIVGTSIVGPPCCPKTALCC